MLWLRAKRYNFLLNHLMSKDEMSLLLSNKYNLGQPQKQLQKQSPTHIKSILFPHRDEISLLLLNKYNLSLATKPVAANKKTK